MDACLSRNDSVEKGERDRHGRSHRRLADGVRTSDQELDGAGVCTSIWSAGRRPVRARRTRSPNELNRSD
jgi:hypothetical protein